MDSTSARDHGTPGYFRSLLHRNTVKADVKKAVDANVEFLLTVCKGHILACACQILEIDTLDGNIHLPAEIIQPMTPPERQLQFVKRIASQVVERCTLIDTCATVAESDDKVYNYA